MNTADVEVQNYGTEEDGPRYLPWWWHALLFLTLVVGIVFWIFNWELADWTTAVATRVRQDAWFQFFGILLVAIPISYWVIWLCMIGVEKAFYGSYRSTRKDLWPPALLGSLEGLMYPVAFLIDETGLIGIWLAIKAVGQWAPNFSAAPNGDREELKAHRRFDRFLIGNALRLILSAATFVAMKAFVLK